MFCPDKIVVRMPIGNEKSVFSLRSKKQLKSFGRAQMIQALGQSENFTKNIPFQL